MESYIKKIFKGIMIVFLLILIGSKEKVLANEWVYDEPNVVSEETVEYIKTLNEVIFPSYEDKPQLGIIIVRNMPAGYSMDEYKLELFNEYGVGTKEENCGMLFVFAIDDRKYGLEIGDGFSKGSLIREILENDFITDDMKNSLREGNYDVVIYQVAEYLALAMKYEDDGSFAAMEQEMLLKQQQRDAKIAEFMYRIMLSGMYLLIFLVVGLIAAVLLYFICRWVYIYSKKKVIRGLLGTYYRQIRIIAKPEEDIVRYVIDNAASLSTNFLSENMLQILYPYYVAISLSALKSMELKNSISWYKEYFDKVNDKSAFCQAHVQELDTIIRETDQEIEIKQEIQRQNSMMVHEYVISREKELLEKGVSVSEIEEKLHKYYEFGKSLTLDELEGAYKNEFRELCFKKSYDEFVQRNEKLIDKRYFNNASFYQSLRTREQYQEYNVGMSDDMSWILPLLMLHTNEQRMREIHRQEQQKKEEIRRQEQQKREDSIDFDSGFGGGFSSGGGFTGGW